MSPRVLRCRWLPLLALVFAACATVEPLQPASALPPGTWRVGGQVSVAPWCGLSGDLAGGCASLPSGTPTPELRVQGRRGWADGTDVGASVHASLLVPPGSGFTPALRAGALVDLKRELWGRTLEPDRRQVLSVAPGVGYALVSVPPRGLQTFGHELALALPVLFGHQTDGYEWVASARLVPVLRLRPDVDPAQRVQLDPEAGLGLGVFRRRGLLWGLQLGYQTPLGRPGAGAFQLALSLMFEGPNLSN